MAALLRTITSQHRFPCLILVASQTRASYFKFGLTFHDYSSFHCSAVSASSRLVSTARASLRRWATLTS